jgi:outer membrane protein OmpA-like peptidoglycan-associated protein
MSFQKIVAAALFTGVLSSSALAVERATIDVAQAGTDDQDEKKGGPAKGKEGSAPKDKGGPGVREPGPGGEAEPKREPGGAAEKGPGLKKDRGATKPEGGEAAPPEKGERKMIPKSAPRELPPLEKKSLEKKTVPAPPRGEPKPKIEPKAAPKELPPLEKKTEPAPPAEEPKSKIEPKLAPKAAPQEKLKPQEKAKEELKPQIEPKEKAEPKRLPGFKGKEEPALKQQGVPEPAPKSGEEAAPKTDLKRKGPEVPPQAAPTPKEGAPVPAAPADKSAEGKGPGVAPPEVKDLKELKEERKERSEDGGKRIVIEEPDKRAIIKEGGRSIIRHDETERFRRLSRDTRVERRDGLDVSVTIRPGGIQIFTDLDDQGRSLRRYRRDRDGREIILFDNRDFYRRHRGGSFVDAIIDLPPPRLRIPREHYIVEYDTASDEDVYEALSAEPVEDLDRGYSLEEVRRSPMLRDRMRRVDLDTINFEFGAWEVSRDQYPALARVARAMKRVIDANPEEMFLIEGHTDAVGSDEDNLSLSDRRAEAVSIILTEEFQVPPENMTTQGYGEQYLKVQTDQPERQNRRVAVRRITPLLSRN